MRRLKIYASTAHFVEPGTHVPHNARAWSSVDRLGALQTQPAVSNDKPERHGIENPHRFC